MNRITSIVGILVLSLITALGVAFVNPSKTTVVEKAVGGVGTLDGIDFPFVNIAGNKYANFGTGLIASSSVICSIKNPYSASTTLENFRLSIISAGGVGAQVVDISTSTSPFASGTTYGTSSTPFVQNQKTPAGAFAVSYFPTTGTAAVIAPGQYVNVRIATATPTAFTTYPTGTCSGVFLAY